jgi:hypothetical protein
MQAPALEQQSEISRISGIFSEPRRAFLDIIQRPRWYIPVIILTLCSLTLVTVYSQRVGWERLIRTSMEQSSRVQDMPADQRERAIEMGVKFGAITGYVQSAIGPLLAVLIAAAALMFTANTLLDTGIRYPQMLGITAYSYLTGVVQTALIILVMFLKPPEDFDLRNPLAFNAGAFLNTETTPKWLTSLAGSLDLFSIWTMVLLAIGISAAGRNISTGKAASAVVIPWLLWVCVKTAWTSMFG